MPIGRPWRASIARIATHQLAHARLRRVAHVDAEDVGAGHEQPLDHRRIGRSRAQRGDDLGAAFAFHRAGAPGRVCAGCCKPARPVAPRRSRRHRRNGLALFGQLQRPVLLFDGVDLEEAGAVIAAREAVLDAADGEFALARAHEGLARPFAALVVVDRVDVIEARDQRPADQRLAGIGADGPPAFGGPASLVLVADRDPDPARGAVAQAEIGERLQRPQQRQSRTARAPRCGPGRMQEAGSNEPPHAAKQRRMRHFP